MTMKTFAKPNTENSRRLNLAAVKRLKYPLQQKLSKLRYDQLHKA
jgi:hypothetical protein